MNFLEESHLKNLYECAVPLIPIPFPGANCVAEGTRMVYKWPFTPWALRKALNSEEKSFVGKRSLSRVLPGFTAEGLGPLMWSYP